MQHTRGYVASVVLLYVLLVFALLQLSFRSAVLVQQGVNLHRQEMRALTTR